MIFPTTVAGIPCQCCIDEVYAGRAAVITGNGPWYPEEPAEVEYHLLDRKGYRAPWLEAKLTEADHERLVEECFRYLKDSEDFEPPDVDYFIE